MKIPDDCQLLTLGMKFVRLVFENKFSELKSCIKPDTCESQIEKIIANDSYRSMMANLNTIHALVKEEQNPRLFLLFNVGQTDLFSHILFCTRDPSGVLKFIFGLMELLYINVFKVRIFLSTMS